MSKSEFLHYGCDILISIQSTSFINCSGFIDKSLYLSQSDDIPDVLQSVFRIFPKCEHENQSTLILSLSSPDALEFENAFSELSDLLDLEIKTNLENFYNCKGKEIKFGSTVYLQHAQSHKFLTIRSNNASLSEPDCFQVILTDFPEDSSFVVLQHCYNFQKEGNGCIQANDIVVLEFPKAKTAQSVFLTAAAEKTVIEQRFGTSFANEIIGSVDKKTFWNLALYSEINLDPNDSVWFGNYLWISYAEDNVALIGEWNESKKKFFIKYSKDSFCDTKKLWKIENENEKIGGKLLSNKSFRLKHLTTGLYLSVKTNKKGQIKPKLLNEKNDESLWCFLPLHNKKTDLSVYSGRVYSLVNKVSGVILQGNKNFDENSNKSPKLENEIFEDSYLKISKADENSIWESLFLMSCVPILQNFKEFIFYQRQNMNKDLSVQLEKFINNMDLIMSCLHQIDEFIRNKQQNSVMIGKNYGHIDNHRQSRIKELGILDILSEIIDNTFVEKFSLEKLSDILLFEQDKKRTWYDERQITDINNYSTRFQMTQLKKMVKLIYQVILTACENNDANQSYIIKYFYIYQKNIGYGLETTKFLTSLIQNNEKLLVCLGQRNHELFHNSPFSVIDYYFEELKVIFIQSSQWGKKPILLDYLSAICLCENNGISANQEKVHENIILYKENIMVPIVYDEESCEYVVDFFSENKKFVFFECFNNGNIIENHSEIKYFKAVLDLASNLCRSRNFICRPTVNSWIPFEFIKSSIWNTNLTVDIRASFLDLMMSLYIDFQPRNYEKKPELFRSFDWSNSTNYSNFYENFKIFEFEKEKTILADEENLKSLETEKQGVYKEKGPKKEKKLTSEIFELKSNLILYLESIDQVNFDVFLLQILKLSTMLIKFSIITDSANISDENVSQILSSSDNTDIFRVLSSLPKILFENVSSDIVNLRSRKSIMPIKKVKISDYVKKLSKNKKIFHFSKDFFSNFFEGTRKFLEFQTYRSEIDKEIENIEIKCKIEICEIFFLLIDLRQEYLISNFLKGFKIYQENNEMDLEIEKILPPLLTLDNKQKTHEFNPFLHPVFENITIGDEKMVENLIFLFGNVENYKLKTKILMILLRIFGERKELFKSLKKVKIMTNEKDFPGFFELRKILPEFRNLAEQSEILCRYWAQPQIIYEKCFKNFKKLVESLENLEKLMNISSNPEAYNTKNYFIDKNIQILLKTHNFHLYILKIIKIGFLALTDLKDKNLSKETLQSSLENLKKLLKLSHKVLIGFVHSNKTNQKSLFHHLQTLTENLKFSFGQIDLLCEIFRNNYDLCSSISEAFLNIFVDIIIIKGRQAEFLKIFEVITEARGKEIVDNKRMILKIITSPAVFSIVCFMDSHGKFVFECKKDEVFDFFGESYKDEPFEYHQRLFNVLVHCGKNSYDFQLIRDKCQRIIPIEDVFELLIKNGRFSKLEHSLVNILCKIYLDDEKYGQELKNNMFLEVVEIRTKNVKKWMDFKDFDLDLIETWLEVLEKCSFRLAKFMNPDSFYLVFKGFLEVLASKLFLFKELNPSQNFVIRLSNLFEKFKIYEDLSFVQPGISSERKQKSVKTNEIRKKLDSYDTKKYIKEEQNLLLQFLFKNNEENLPLNMITIHNIIKYISLYTIHKPKPEIFKALIKFLGFCISDSKKIKEKKRSLGEIIKKEFEKIGIINIILPILCEKRINLQIFSVLIEFSYKLLKNGNKMAQKDFFIYFYSVPASENLFERIHQIILEFIVILSKFSLKNTKNLPNFLKYMKITLKIVKFMQQLCENHNNNLQNYLRFQQNSYKNYDLVDLLIKLLQELMILKDFSTFKLIQQCFDTLTELIQGPCIQNQKAIIDSKFLEICWNILSLDEKTNPISNYRNLKAEEPSQNIQNQKPLKSWMISSLKYKSLVAILGLLEGHQDNFYLIRIVRSINLEIFKENMVSVHSSYKEKYGDGYYKDDIFSNFQGKKSKNLTKIDKNNSFIIEVGFMVYHLINHFININDKTTKKLIFDQLPEISKIKKKLEEKIWKKEKSLENVVNIIENKVKGLNRRISPIKEVSSHKKFAQALKFFEKNTRSVEVAFNESLCITYFWVLPIYHHLTDENEKDFHDKVNRSSDKKKLEFMVSKVDEIINDMEYEKKLSSINCYKFMTKQIKWLKKLVFALSLALNIVILISYSSYNADRLWQPSFLNIEIDNTFELRFETTQNVIITLGVLHCFISGLIFLSFMIKTAPIIVQRLWNKEKALLKKNPGQKQLKKSIMIIKTMGSSLLNINISYYLLYFTFSILGISLHPFFFAVHLLDIIFISHTLQEVVMSIILPGKQLLLTLCFILIIVYYFSIWAYLRLNDFYVSYCSSLLNCFRTTFDQGFKNSGGIGMWIAFLPDPPPKGIIQYERFFFDNLFNIILLWIMLNIISGIIVVAFFIIREKDENDKDDVKNVCFICGLRKDVIEKNIGRSFEYHRKYEHNEWNYIFFIAYLTMFKKETEYTGIESYVRKMIDKEEIGWIPQNQAFFLKKNRQDNEFTKRILNAKSELDGLKEVVDRIEKNYQNESRISNFI